MPPLRMKKHRSESRPRRVPNTNVCILDGCVPLRGSLAVDPNSAQRTAVPHDDAR